MEVRELTGLSKSTISELENDKSSPKAETLEKLAKALGVPMEMFFKSEVEPEGKPQPKEDIKSTVEEPPVIFNTPQAAMEFILKQPTIMGFGGFDIDQMSDQEIIEFANELLRQLQLISYKFKK